MNVVIIEDELLIAQDLNKLISSIDSDIKVLTILESVKSAKDYFSSRPSVDLIFSDIQLADGVSFDIFRDPGIDCPIVFTTAYNEYAISAFKLNSIDYLLKPIDEKELRIAIDKFKKLYTNQNSKEFKVQFQDFLKQLKQTDKIKYKTRFTGHQGKSIVSVQEEEIAYFTKDELIFVVTIDNKQILTDYHSLEDLEVLLDPSKYIRANRQNILNIQSIDHIKTHLTGKLNVTLKSPLKAEITVSREKSSEFRRWFDGI